MSRDELVPVDAPRWVLDRLNKMATRNPLSFVQDRVPALGHKTVNEVLAEPDGRRKVDQFLDRLEAKLGVKRDEDDFVISAAFDWTAIERHDDFHRETAYWVEHAEGWRVGVVSMHMVAYDEGDRSADLDASIDDDGTVRVDGDSIRWFTSRSTERTQTDSDLVFARLEKGLAAVGARQISWR